MSRRISLEDGVSNRSAAGRRWREGLRASLPAWWKNLPGGDRRHGQRHFFPGALEDRGAQRTAMIQTLETLSLNLPRFPLGGLAQAGLVDLVVSVATCTLSFVGLCAVLWLTVTFPVRVARLAWGERSRMREVTCLVSALLCVLWLSSGAHWSILDRVPGQQAHATALPFPGSYLRLECGCGDVDITGSNDGTCEMEQLGLKEPVVTRVSSKGVYLKEGAGFGFFHYVVGLTGHGGEFVPWNSVSNWRPVGLW